jgi:hypothetical protein
MKNKQFNLVLNKRLASKNHNETVACNTVPVARKNIETENT